MALFSSSTNGIAEYTASNFSGEMQGDLLVVSYNGVVSRIELDAAGDELAAPVSSLFSGFGVNPLDVVALSDSDIFPGTVWVAVYGSNAISVFEPGDYGGVEIPGCEGSDDDGLDEDSDGYSNADEIDNGTSPCSAGGIPAGPRSRFRFRPERPRRRQRQPARQRGSVRVGSRQRRVHGSAGVPHLEQR